MGTTDEQLDGNIFRAIFIIFLDRGVGGGGRKCFSNACTTF
jgi:hypothetical protein